MPFRVQPIKEFLVRPALPPALNRLPELGLNLVWSWHHPLRAIFRRLEPTVWRESNHNPVVMLGRVPQPILERAANDPRYLGLYRRGCEIFDAYMAAARPAPKDMLVAYFSMEYGLLDCMPIYSGGLGVLSGDHLKASSDAVIPLVGVGLLYQRGYLQQTLDADGWQQERNPVNDFYSLPISPVEIEDQELLVSVHLAGTEVWIKVWCIDVGRVKLYLLDTNIPQNADPAHRDITSQLYGGDLHKRICQEIVLGIGGLRALKKLNLTPTVFHMNEGHSAFLAIERMRVMMADDKLTFPEALEASRVNNIFTTHTSVPAGIDLFDPGLMYEYFQQYCQEAGVPFDELLALGRHDRDDQRQPFSMAVLAIRTSAYRNAVSKLHQTVSQQMWEGLWPSLPIEEVPITSITNGVHLPSWINGDFATLYDQYLPPDWREGHSDVRGWDYISEIPDAELWEAHRRRKRRMVTYIRERAVAAAEARKAPSSEIRRLENVLDPEALTIGFARRFATYKRATLIFRDLARLAKLLTNLTRPVQIVISGKAHPLDVPGKSLIREIVQHSRDSEMARRIVFVEDYGIQVARELVGGVDIWLNTPRRGEEACGTSGMKAGMNGVLNMSILDGWFDEAADSAGGWAIGGREPYSPDRDDAHAAAIYTLLEDEVVPLYYEGREQGVPVEWVHRVKKSLRYITAQFNCRRMVCEYQSELYQPAHAAFAAVCANKFEAVHEKVAWSQRIDQAWPNVHFLEALLTSGGLPADSVSTGAGVKLNAKLDLGGLEPQDVKVEAVVGRVGVDGELEQMQVLTLDGAQKQADGFLFSTDFVPKFTGRLGFAVRVTPNHFDSPLTRPCNSPMKWAERP